MQDLSLVLLGRQHPTRYIRSLRASASWGCLETTGYWSTCQSVLHSALRLTGVSHMPFVHRYAFSFDGAFRAQHQQRSWHARQTRTSTETQSHTSFFLVDH